MTQNIPKFESLMFQYCSDQVERAYKLLEDNENKSGMEYLAHVADVLLMLKDSRVSAGSTNLDEFASRTKDFPELWRDQLWSFFQENGLGQFIPE